MPAAAAAPALGLLTRWRRRRRRLLQLRAPGPRVAAPNPWEMPDSYRRKRRRRRRRAGKEANGAGCSCGRPSSRRGPGPAPPSVLVSPASSERVAGSPSPPRVPPALLSPSNRSGLGARGAPESRSAGWARPDTPRAPSDAPSRIRRGERESRRVTPHPQPTSGPGESGGPTHPVHPDMDPPGLTQAQTHARCLSSAPSLGQTHIHGNLEMGLPGGAKLTGQKVLWDRLRFQEGRRGQVILTGQLAPGIFTLQSYGKCIMDTRPGTGVKQENSQVPATPSLNWVP